MSEKIVLAFYGGGANDAVRGMIAAYGDALSSRGLSVVHVDMNEAEIQYAVDQIASGQVAFVLTWLGVGQDLMVTIGEEGERKNVWEAFRVPLVKLHGDTPAYFVDRHRDIPRNAVNLYPASEFVHFRTRCLPNERCMTAVMPLIALAPIDRSTVDVPRRRNGKLVFLKNGNPPNQLRQSWNDRLTPAVARLVCDSLPFRRLWRE